MWGKLIKSHFTFFDDLFFFLTYFLSLFTIAFFPTPFGNRLGAIREGVDSGVGTGDNVLFVSLAFSLF